MSDFLFSHLTEKIVFQNYFANTLKLKSSTSCLQHSIATCCIRYTTLVFRLDCASVQHGRLCCNNL